MARPLSNLQLFLVFTVILLVFALTFDFSVFHQVSEPFVKEEMAEEVVEASYEEDAKRDLVQEESCLDLGFSCQSDGDCCEFSSKGANMVCKFHKPTEANRCTHSCRFEGSFCSDELKCCEKGPGGEKLFCNPDTNRCQDS